ncbi:ABC transporter ATP-binding protein [Bacillus paranthracis]|uniref:ABC transporter ATP-binding protein n=1 Tax=Bacillus paranthracis TaxID=2026186 RepID=UPI002E1CD796|nr:ABC transporter ATP-binding protein [Bacillus paranthracis]MED1680046.1 ABC transporter ATP-binding protein [Bacillus paranthracis]
MITLKNVQFEYQAGKPLLKNINLTIQEGECVLITGPSGSGKTTLGRILNGLIPNFYEGNLQGDIIIDNVHTKDTPIWELSKKIGSVFQDPKSQFFTSIVQDELAFELENYGIERGIIEQRLQDVLHQMELVSIQHQHVMSLSSGQKQKVAIAAAQLINPPLFVMDEPSANLDLQATNILKEELLSLREKKKTIVIVEHRLYYLMNLVDRIIYMDNGEIQNIYTPHELLALSCEEIEELGLRSPFIEKGKMNNLTSPSKLEKLQIEGLHVKHKCAKDWILQNLNITLYANEVTALIGKNGAGKTTFARTLTGLKKECAGNIHIDNMRLKANKRMQKIWFVMQDTVYQLFTDSVWNEVLLNHPNQEEMAENVLKTLHLWHLRENHPATLSGGEKQRLVLAIGLMNEASIFILDEPTSGLDGMNLRRVIEVIQQLAKRFCHVLIITHDHELVAGACQRVLKLRDGKITTDVLTRTFSYRELVDFMYEIE